MKYAIIVWTTDVDIPNSNGIVYNWYESLATALNTATNLQQSGEYAQATVVKII